MVIVIVFLLISVIMGVFPGLSSSLYLFNRHSSKFCFGRQWRNVSAGLSYLYLPSVSLCASVSLSEITAVKMVPSHSPVFPVFW